MENIVSHHDNALAKLHARNLDESFLPNLGEQTEWASLITNMKWSYEEELKYLSFSFLIHLRAFRKSTKNRFRALAEIYGKNTVFFTVYLPYILR
jgi:hypothetical protein